MSAVVVPTSSAVMYRPPSESTIRPKASNSCGDFRVRESPRITALPPPKGNPAIAFLKLMPRERRSASVTASSLDS
jgi:hypothetical protein